MCKCQYYSVYNTDKTGANLGEGPDGPRPPFAGIFVRDL